MSSIPPNPYSSPSAALFGGQGGTSGLEVTEAALLHLRATRPWVLFFAILSWLACGLLFVVAGAVLIGSLVGGAELAQASPGGNPAYLTGVSVAYFLIALLYILPAVKLTGYSGAIKRVVLSRSSQDLEIAMNKQRSLWKTAGILSILGIIGYILVVVGIVIMTANQMLR